MTAHAIDTATLAGAPLLTAELAEADPAMSDVLTTERLRQRAALHLLAPSMLVSRAVRECLSSALLNLDGEGYLGAADDPPPSFPAFAASYRRRGARKYNPSGPVAEYVETIARHRLAALLCARTGLEPADVQVNVQPVSGSIANLALFRGVLSPGDTVVSLAGPSGGHLSHGASFHASGHDYRVVQASLSVDDAKLDPVVLARLTAEHGARLVVVGASSFPRHIDWRGIAGALAGIEPQPVLAADIAHFAGLVATGAYPNPLPWVDVVSMVGYKTFGGPKSAALITRSPELARQLNRSLFPGLQGAPRLAEIAALATAAHVAGTAAYRAVIAESVAVAAALGAELTNRGMALAFGGTDTHMLLLKNCSDAVGLARYLERAGIFVNANQLPGDDKPGRANGIRIGTVALVQRGLTRADVPGLADLLAAAIRGYYAGADPATYAIAVRGFVAARLSELD